MTGAMYGFFPVFQRIPSCTLKVEQYRKEVLEIPAFRELALPSDHNFDPEWKYFPDDSSAPALR